MAKPKKPGYSAMGFRIVKLPRRMRKTTVFRKLIAATKTGKLPEGWQVLWGWRNAPDIDGTYPVNWGLSSGFSREMFFGQVELPEVKPQPESWRTDTFENVIANSRGGFTTLMRRRLEKELEATNATRKRRKPRKPKRRAKTKKATRRRGRQVSKVRRSKPRGKRTARRRHKARLRQK